MKIADCLQFAREHPVCSFATMDGNQPRVRVYMLWYTDLTGFYFHTVGFKQAVDQIRKNPKVELCFTAPPSPPEPLRMMRVSGTCDIIDDPAILSRLYDERISHLPLGSREALLPLLVVLHVSKGEIRFWKMENFLMEKEILRIDF